MDISLLETTARELVRSHHGILACDDSVKTNAKRFNDVGVENTVENRRSYRQILLQSPKAKEILSGVIFYEETFEQQVDDGRTFPEYARDLGILPGIKLDQGLQDLAGFPGEKITAGLDALPERAEKYAKLGARFAKWRNVIAIGDGIPTDECIGSNTYILSRYARICQDFGIVPIVEPEVLMEGEHTAEECERITARVYDLMFHTMRSFRVHLPGAVMKTAMVVPGKASQEKMDPEQVAERTVRVLKNHVPAELGGVVFLSGGQSMQQAFVNLNRIEQRAKDALPFGVTFSYLRALQDPALAYWARHKDTSGTHAIFDDLLSKAAAAREGALDESSLATDLAGSGEKSGAWEY